MCRCFTGAWLNLAVCWCCERWLLCAWLLFQLLTVPCSARLPAVGRWCWICPAQPPSQVRVRRGLGAALHAPQLWCTPHPCNFCRCCVQDPARLSPAAQTCAPSERQSCRACCSSLCARSLMRTLSARSVLVFVDCRPCWGGIGRMRHAECGCAVCEIAGISRQTPAPWLQLGITQLAPSIHARGVSSFLASFLSCSWASSCCATASQSGCQSCPPRRWVLSWRVRFSNLQCWAEVCEEGAEWLSNLASLPASVE